MLASVTPAGRPAQTLPQLHGVKRSRDPAINSKCSRVQVFDKDSSFDPRADPIVRVQARRLRARLVRYYREEGGTDALVIELPKGGYTPVFKNREATGSSRRSLGTTLAGQNTIAVQPFADHSPAKELGYFCDGLQQEIIHSLAKFRPCELLAVQPGAGLALGFGQRCAGQVALLLTGGVRKSGERVRVTVHRRHAEAPHALWSESVDVALGDDARRAGVRRGGGRPSSSRG